MLFVFAYLRVGVIYLYVRQVCYSDSPCAVYTIHMMGGYVNDAKHIANTKTNKHVQHQTSSILLSLNN
jgi:hypothetical protein